MYSHDSLGSLVTARAAPERKKIVTELDAEQYLQSRVVFLFLFSCAVLCMVTKRQSYDSNGETDPVGAATV